MRRTVVSALGLGLAALLVDPAPASANGRFPATVNIRFEPGADSLLLVPATFGLLLSTDDGDTFRWICEDVIGYGGTYDPDYAVTADGRIYATTFDGLKVSSDGSCTYQATTFYLEPATDTPTTEPLEGHWVGEAEVASDGSIWAVTSTGSAVNAVFHSTDGQTFFSVGLERENVWWKSVKVHDADPQVAYVSGFQPSQNGGEIPHEGHLYKTTDGGATWTDLGVDDFTFGVQPNLVVEGVSPTDPDVVFVRVLGVNEPYGDALYRSTDGGETFTKVLDFADVMTAFAILSDGQTVIAGSMGTCPDDPVSANKGCVRISHDAGATWETPASEPRMACVGERSDGTLFACGANWEPDNFALGQSSDGGDTWEKVMRFSEITGPLSCDDGTQQKTCAVEDWPQLCVMLGICEFEGGEDAGPTAGDAGPQAPDDDGGGCGCGAGGAAGGLATILLVWGPMWVASRRRRRA